MNTCLPGLRDEKLLIYVFAVTEKKINFQFYAGRSNVHNFQRCCCCCKQLKVDEMAEKTPRKLNEIDYINNSKAF